MDDVKRILEPYIDMMSQIEIPQETLDKTYSMISDVKQDDPCQDLEGAGHSTVVWKRENGLGADYDWSSRHFKELCDIVVESGMAVTVSNGIIDVVIINPA